jgi:hypothetical protein
VRFPTFESLIPRHGWYGVQYDHERGMRYASWMHFRIWEDGVVDLVHNFYGDTDRDHWGARTQLDLDVFSSNELPTRQYDFLAPDGYKIKKADLEDDGHQMILVDWKHMVAMRAYKPFVGRGSARGYTARWWHPEAMPVPKADLTYRVLDKAQAKAIRAYAEELGNAAEAIMRVRGFDRHPAYVSDDSTRRHILLQRPPIADVLQQNHHEGALSLLASYCRSNHVATLCAKQRLTNTCTYLKVVPKGEPK